MTCQGCRSSVEKYLSNVPDVSEVKASLEKGGSRSYYGQNI